MKENFFTIVIPTYNRAHLIEKTIESVIAQNYKNYELIIVDDGSTDNTENVVSKYLNSSVSYHKKENSERAASRNYGTKLAKGNYVNWFDSDDLMFPSHLEEANKIIESYKSPEVFALPYQIQDTNGKVLKQYYFSQPTVNDKLYEGNFLACNPVFVRRDVALRFPFDETRILSASEDYDLWMKLAARFPVFSSDKITSALVQHDERSMMNLNMPKIEQRIELAWQNLWKDEMIALKYGKHKSFMFAYKEAFLGLHYSQAGNKISALKKLYKSISSHPSMIKKKIIYATVKRIIFN